MPAVFPTSNIDVYAVFVRESFSSVRNSEPPMKIAVDYGSTFEPCNEMEAITCERLFTDGKTNLDAIRAGIRRHAFSGTGRALPSRDTENPEE